MHIGATEILDTHAEAFSARYARLVVTAIDEHWVDAAVRATAGYATSVIGCDCEAGVDRILRMSETSDGRPGVSLLFFAFTTKKLAGGVANRVGQCVLTCPTTACFNDLPQAAESIPLGDWIRYFGDGYESREQGAGSRESNHWRIPVMDGEFVVDDVAGVEQGIGGGNLILHAESQAAGLAAALRAAGVLTNMPNIITPFPGGVCRSGSKVGSRYKNLIASTDEVYCPTLRDEVASQLVASANCAYEIVINGVDLAAVREAMRAAIEAAAGPGVLAIGARNFGGKLGKYKIGLHDLFAKP
ncbi:MAG: formylmethanofuran--tetrahydromethanopterin N-formyltransferase [Pirellulales bacterium]